MSLETGITAVVCDFGGVLTSPLGDAFTALTEGAGITLEQLGGAMMALAAARGAHPLHELERGELAEAAFGEALGAELATIVGRPVSFGELGEALFAGLHPNLPFLEHVRALRARGLSTAICTNNVREWSERWRSMIPIEELFDVVVDSSEVGARKPDREIYEVTLRELGVAPGAAVLVDDIEANCDGARAVGMAAVWFRETEQAIAELDALLAPA